MSTSSSSSSSINNTGSNRFRGDAASFSPSQPPFYPYQPHQSHQQYPSPHQPQHHHHPQQQHQYMQYAAPHYPVMMNQMVYPQMYMPMYSDMYYGNQPYMVPQHVPFTPNINNSYRPKSNYKRSSSANHYNPKMASNFIPSSSSSSTPYEENDASKDASSPATEPSETSTTVTLPSPAPSPKPKHAQKTQPEKSNEHSRSIDTKHTNNNETNEPSTETDQQKEEDHQKEQQEKTSHLKSPSPSSISNDNIPIEPFISYPLFINTDAESFTKKKSIILDSLRPEHQQFLSRLNQSKSLYFDIKEKKIINYNTNETTVTNIRGTLSEKSIDSSSPPSTNWASILQTSFPSVKKDTKEHKKSSPTLNNTNGSLPTPPSTVASANGGFNIKNEAVQPLGILLLRIMFDSNYSVINPANQIPSFNINPRGLTNTGNICYMNSILQVLLYCQPFNKLLKLIEEKSVGSLGVSKTPLLDATLQFFNEFIGLKSSSLSPENFYMNLISHEKFNHLKWGQQEDAEEFLGYYLDGLNDEFLSTMKSLTTPQIDSLIQGFVAENEGDTARIEEFKYNIKSTIRLIKEGGVGENGSDSKNTNDNDEWNEVGANNKKIANKRTVEIEPTPITMIFGGQFKSVLTIPKNPNSNQYQKSITMDPFQHVQLDISESSSIEQAIEKLNQFEKISYKMKDSSKDIQIKKQTFIDKLPTVLIIHLKRFSFLKEKDVGIEKLRKKVEYNHKLNIPPEIISNKSVEDENNEYRLIGVIYHHGSGAQGGHYTSDVRRQVTKSSQLLKKDWDNEPKESNQDRSFEWIRIDDTQLKSITEEEVLDGGAEENIKNAYILMYERVL